MISWLACETEDLFVGGCAGWIGFSSTTGADGMSFGGGCAGRIGFWTNRQPGSDESFRGSQTSTTLQDLPFSPSLLCLPPHHREQTDVVPQTMFSNLSKFIYVCRAWILVDAAYRKVICTTRLKPRHKCNYFVSPCEAWE